MAAKVGGIYVSLALNTAEFSGGIERSVAEMRKFDKLQEDMAHAIDRVNAKAAQQAIVVGQLALSNLKLGPTISLIAMHAQQYYQAMERAAKSSEHFSRTGAGLSSLMKSISANWVVLVVQIAKYAIDEVLDRQLEKARQYEAATRREAERVQRNRDRASERWEQNLQDQYDRAIGKEKEVTVASIAEWARRTHEYPIAYKRAQDLIARAAEKHNKELADKAFKARVEAWEKELDAHAEYIEEMDRREQDRKRKEEEGAKAAIAHWQSLIDMARRYADIVTGAASGAWSSMVSSMEVAGRIAGVPGQAASERMFQATQGPLTMDNGKVVDLLATIAKNTEVQFAL